jgi:putative Ca2+/H+ antiporter (TMEM165/GDT1 family)
MGELLSIFLAVFLAELGDKTQLATMLFAGAGKATPLTVFLAASAALVASTAIAVLVGAIAKEWLAGVPLKLLAGFAFVAIGGWMIVDWLRPNMA